MSLQLRLQISAAVAVAVIFLLLRARRRLGTLNVASWLVIWGVVIIATEHPLLAVAFTVPLKGIVNEMPSNPMPLLPHARTHFMLAGIYSMIGLVLLSVIARTLLRKGERAGWYALLFVLVFGAGSDVVVGSQWFQHGSLLYRLFGQAPLGFGWEFLYTCYLAWSVALLIAYPSIFNPPGKNRT